MTQMLQQPTPVFVFTLTSKEISECKQAITQEKTEHIPPDKLAKYKTQLQRFLDTGASLPVAYEAMLALAKGNDKQAQDRAKQQLTAQEQESLDLALQIVKSQR